MATPLFTPRQRRGQAFRQQCRGTARRAHAERGRRGRRLDLLERQVHRRRHGLAQRTIHGIGDVADDLALGIGAARARGLADAAAHRVRAAGKLARERFVDDDDRGRAALVRGREVTSGEHLRAVRFEPIGAHEIHVHALVGDLDGLAVEQLEPVAPRAAAHRRDDGERCSRHARRGRRGLPEPDQQVRAHVRFELQRLDVDGRDQHGLAGRSRG